MQWHELRIGVEQEVRIRTVIIGHDSINPERWVEQVLLMDDDEEFSLIAYEEYLLRKKN